MRILLISTSFNSFTQGVLTDLMGARVSIELPLGPDGAAQREQKESWGYAFTFSRPTPSYRRPERFLRLALNVSPTTAGRQ
jgi:hypothetical protein